MAVTGTYTYREMITDALREAGVVSIGDEADAEEILVGLRAANRLLKSWQNQGWNLWAYASQSVTLTTAASYTLSPVRPIQIASVRYKQNGREMPMIQMTRDEYDTLPQKTTTGTPTQFYYDKQREAALLYVWPVLATASGQTLEITYIREFEDVTLDAAADIPGEAYEAFHLNLAARLSSMFGMRDPFLFQQAEMALQKMLAMDSEGSVSFVDYDAR